MALTFTKTLKKSHWFDVKETVLMQRTHQVIANDDYDAVRESFQGEGHYNGDTPGWEPVPGETHKIEVIDLGEAS